MGLPVVGLNDVCLYGCFKLVTATWEQLEILVIKAGVAHICTMPTVCSCLGVSCGIPVVIILSLQMYDIPSNRFSLVTCVVVVVHKAHTFCIFPPSHLGFVFTFDYIFYFFSYFTI